MDTQDLRLARREARQSAQLAVRAYARDPNLKHEQAVQQAWERVRMLEELSWRLNEAPAEPWQGRSAN